MWRVLVVGSVLRHVTFFLLSIMFSGVCFMLLVPLHPSVLSELVIAGVYLPLLTCAELIATFYCGIFIYADYLAKILLLDRLLLPKTEFFIVFLLVHCFTCFMLVADWLLWVRTICQSLNVMENTIKKIYKTRASIYWASLTKYPTLGVLLEVWSGTELYLFQLFIE